MRNRAYDEPHGTGFWLVIALMYAYPRLRLAEDELPDIVIENQ